MILQRGQKVVLTGIVIAFFVIILYRLYVKNDINENLKYTICKIHNYSNSSSSGEVIYYYYLVNEKKYESSNYYNDKFNAQVGQYYRVEYSSKNPQNSNIIQSERITDSAQIVNAGLKLPKRKPRRNQFKD